MHVRRNNLITHITPHQGHTAVEPTRMSVRLNTWPHERPILSGDRGVQVF